MSADNWSACPRCLHAKEQDAFARIAAVQALYGKVPVEEFDAARAALPKAPDTDDDAVRTFREDYDIGIFHSGTLTVNYRGRCTACNLEVKFKEDHEFWTPDG